MPAFLAHQVNCAVLEYSIEKQMPVATLLWLVDRAPGTRQVVASHRQAQLMGWSTNKQEEWRRTGGDDGMRQGTAAPRWRYQSCKREASLGGHEGLSAEMLRGAKRKPSGITHKLSIVEWCWHSTSSCPTDSTYAAQQASP